MFAHRSATETGGPRAPIGGRDVRLAIAIETVTGPMGGLESVRCSMGN
jgi:hypothetical protein